MRKTALTLAAVAGLAACGTHPFVQAQPSTTVFLDDVHVFDAPNARFLDGTRDILIRDGRIVTVETSIPPPPDAAVVHGGWALPGLIDAHVHVGGNSAPPWKTALPNQKENLLAFLYAGVTTVLDVGSISPDIFEMRDAVAKGTVLGPQMFAAGPMFTTPHGHPVATLQEVVPWPFNSFIIKGLTRQVATPQESGAAVEALAPFKPDFIKIAVDRIPPGAPRIPLEMVAAIASQAHAHGIRAVAHVGGNQDAMDAVNAGVDALVHGIHNEAISDAALALLANRKTPVVFTSSIFDVQARFDPAQQPPVFSALEREIGAPDVLAAMHQPPPGQEVSRFEPWVRLMVASHDARRQNIARMHAAGIPLLVGSDSPNINHLPGAGVHVELDALVAAGIPVGDVLRMATHGNASFLAGTRADFGRLEQGTRGDVVVLNGNPLEDPAAMHGIAQVVAKGRLLTRTARPSK